MALTKIDDRGLKTPIDLLDNEKIRFGTGNDLELYHNGTSSYIKDTGGASFNILATESIAIKTNDSEFAIACNKNGSVELFYDNSKKFETTSGGVTIPNTLTVSDGAHLDGDVKFEDNGGTTNAMMWDKSESSLRFNDNIKIEIGNSDDLQIYHDGSNSYIKQVSSATGNLLIFADGHEIQLIPKSGESGIKVINDGAVELYYDGVKKFETTSEGIETQGELHFKAPNSNTGEQVGRIEWWNENDAGVMAKIGVDRTGGQYAPADLVFSTSGNVDTTAHGGDGDITERLRINTAGFVGINKTSALRSGIHLKSHSNGWVGGILLEENHETCGWNIHPDDNNWLLFGYNSDTTASPGSADHKFNIRNTGDVEIVNGNLVVASGHGIDFSATSDASPTSELLDDYEEGTWTPLLMVASGTNITVDSNSSSGNYTKIGNVVTVTCYHRTDGITKGSASDSSNINIGNLPFTPSSQTQRCMVHIGFNVNWAQYPNTALIKESSTMIELYKYASSGGNNTGTRLTVAAVGTGSNANYCLLTMVYRT